MNATALPIEQPPTLMEEAKEEKQASLERKVAVGTSILLQALRKSKVLAKRTLSKVNAAAALGEISKRVGREHPEWSEARLSTAVCEYKKFIALCIICPNVGLGMCSADVDEIWHAHILYTMNYAKFCKAVAGRFLHHTPTSEEEKAAGDISSSLRTKRLLKFFFGQLDPVWGPSNDGPECQNVQWPITCNQCNIPCVRKCQLNE